jgi:hypothetical protein
MNLKIIFPYSSIKKVSGNPKTPNSRAINPSGSTPTKLYGLPSLDKYLIASFFLSL